MTDEAPLRIGVLGAARITPMALVRPARQVASVQVAAVAARDPHRAQAFADRHGIPRVLPSYDALIADPDIDAVYNPLPNNLHAPWSIAALEAGKHVLCEKPLASNADEAARMVAAAARCDRLLVEAFHYRYHPLAARMKAIVDGGELGAVRHIEAHMCVPLVIPGNIRYRFELAGGATMDTGCYAINMVRFLAGAEPEVVRAAARLSSPNVDRFMEADLRFADGRTARITCSLFSAWLVRLRTRVVGGRGTLSVFNPFLPQFANCVTLRTSERTAHEHVRGDPTYVYQLRAFAEAVRTRAALPTEAGDAVATMRVIDAVYERAGLPRRGT